MLFQMTSLRWNKLFITNTNTQAVCELELSHFSVRWQVVNLEQFPLQSLGIITYNSLV